MAENSPVLDPRREPALWIAVGSAVVQLALSFVPGLDPGLQGVINAVVVALAGFLVALLVRREGQVAAATGLVKAVIALAVGFGVAVTAGQQAMIMTIVTALGALFVRTQVDARIAPDGTPVAADPR